MASPGLLSGSTTEGRGFRRIVVLLVSLVTVPTTLILVLGILMLVFYEANLNVAFGILLVSLVGCVVTGMVIVFLLLRREANLSRLQADFVSKVSHELRTPLTSIRMFVEMLHSKRYKDTAELDACLDVLARETGRLNERIDRLLDWGRMEAGRRVYVFRSEPVEDAIAEAVRVFVASHLGQTVDVKVDIRGTLPNADFDRAAVVDTLTNLLSNAYKYSNEVKDIRIEAERQDRWIRIAVIDHGIGIPRSEHRRVFEKFYRVDDRLSRAVEGSGLGLAIVMHVVHAHKGQIQLESEPGVGSTFTLLLPIRQVAGRSAEDTA